MQRGTRSHSGAWLGTALVIVACERGADPAAVRAAADAELAAKVAASVAATRPAEPWPPAMVWIPGGEFTMGGVGPEANPDELAIHRVRVDGFWMDETEVTNRQFRAFVDATGYVTTAEKKPEWEELRKQLPPDATPPDESALVAGAMVFVPTPGPVPLDDWRRWWTYQPGADWKHPLGPRSSLGDDHEAHPVVQVSWDDAVACCAWAGKRLPTEAEWEFACRGGVDGQRFTWGDAPPSDTFHPANTWQGGFPYESKPLDGFLLTAPVRSFAPDRFGLYDMIGNVWEWCSDWYRADYYESLTGTDAVAVTVNPQGPDVSLDPDEPFCPKRVNRGGSFLCNRHFCASYRPSARMKTSPDSGQIHLGFRGVMSDAAWRAQLAARPPPSK